MMNKIILVFSLLITSSCSYFLSLSVKDGNSAKNITETKKPATYCSSPKLKKQIVASDKNSPRNFQKILTQIKKHNKLKEIDEWALFSIYQSSLRPDLTSPTSKLMILITINNKIKYWHFHKNLNFKGNQPVYPFLYGLHQLLFEFKSQYSLGRLIKILKRYDNSRKLVSVDLYKSLEKIETNLVKNKNLDRSYFKAGQLVQEGESIPKTNLAQFIVKSTYKKKKYYQNSNHLFKYQKSKNQSILCNYDLNLYKHSIYLIKKEQVGGNTFGIQSANGNSFLAVTSQNISEGSSLQETNFLAGDSNYTAPALCLIKNSINKTSHQLVSTLGRDPAQHLHHLILHKFASTNSLQEVDEILKFPRHLFLQPPSRMLFESKRDLTNQLSTLLKFNFPIYHIGSLGNIWSYSKFTKEKSFIIDDRNSGSLKCL